MEKNPIQAVELVRRIRDAQYEETRSLSREELKAFFTREAAAARAEAQQLIGKRASSLLATQPVAAGDGGPA
jgi:hypothetical protein